jgi:hypothetical protein
LDAAFVSRMQRNAIVRGDAGRYQVHALFETMSIETLAKLVSPMRYK